MTEQQQSSVAAWRASVLRERSPLELKKDTVRFIIAIDTSDSMKGDPILQLNMGGRELEAILKQVQADHPETRILVRVLVFSDSAAWQTSSWVEAADFRWVEVVASGPTCFGEALSTMSDELDVERLGTGANQRPPHILVLTDGEPTDDWESALDELLQKKPWGEKSVRSAIACGFANRSVLKQFIGDSGGLLVEAGDPEALRRAIKIAGSSIAENGSKALGDEKTLQEEFDEQMQREQEKKKEKENQETDEDDDDGIAELFSQI